jgi:hypothetical protein
MSDTPDTSRANDRGNRGVGNVPLDRATSGKLTAAKQTATPARAPAAAATAASGSPAMPKKSADRLTAIASDFIQRARNKDDLGDKPGFVQRQATEASWGQVYLASEVAFRVLGKDYDLSRMMLRQYMTGDGDPLVYEPPAPVQKAIRDKFTKPGHYKEISGYGKWSTPDIRNGLGHFDLDVVDAGDGTLIYAVTDRYKFPDSAKGKQVEHGFQVGKPSKGTVDQLNSWFSKMEFTRASGAKEKFELRKDPATGDYTFIVPQSLLVNNGTDFESMGLFTAPATSRPTR